MGTKNTEISIKSLGEGCPALCRAGFASPANHQARANELSVAIWAEAAMFLPMAPMSS